MVALSAVPADVALPESAPLNVVAVKVPAVVSRYTPVSNTCVPVFVVFDVVPVI